MLHHLVLVHPPSSILQETLTNKAQVEEGVATLTTRAYLALQVCIRGNTGGERISSPEDRGGCFAGAGCLGGTDVVLT